MKTRALKNYGSSVGCEVYDIDLNSNDEILELGKIVGEQNIVFVDQKITPDRMLEIHRQWGDVNAAICHKAILKGRLHGRHWREILVLLGQIAKQLNPETTDMASIIVSYLKDAQGRPIGIFSEGELDWHSDQCAYDDAPRMIGLASLSGSANSQTQFLCTHDAYETLSSDMKSMIKELICVHKWQNNRMAPDLDQQQSLLIRYNMVPLDGMETKLYAESVTGLPGIKFPSHSFSHFDGMTPEESEKILAELGKAIYQEKYVYTRDWEDGQVVWMDQEITLHKRPTNVTHGSTRKMCRIISYLNKVFPGQNILPDIRYKGQYINQEEFLDLVDADRKRIFEETQAGSYADPTRPFVD